MAQINLYYHTELETKVSLLPEQISGEMNDFLLTNLRNQVEGKTSEHGIVLKVNNLVSYDYGIISKSNFMATTLYNVKYKCLLCSPTKNLEFACVLDNVVKGILVGRNGPVTVAIQFSNIDSQKFKIDGDNIVDASTNKIIKKGDHLKVSVINVKINLRDTNITTICKLLNVASDKDVKKYKEEQILVAGGSEDQPTEFI